LGGGWFESEDFVSAGEGDASLLGALEVAFEDEVGFVDFFEGTWFFADGGGEGVESCGAAFKFSGEGLEESFIHFVEAVLIDLEHLESGDGGGGGSNALGAGESVVANPAEEIIGDAWGTTAAAGDFGGSGLLELDIVEGGGAADDSGEIFGGIVIESVGDAEAGAEWGAEEACAGGGSDEGEARKVEANRAGGGALIDDDIDTEIFDGGVEVFFDDFGEAMDFVDEEDISFLESGEEASEVASFFDGGA